MSKLFVSNEKIFELVEKYGSPLYVYDENTLRLRCREMKNLKPCSNFRVNYSAKANSNLELLRIVLDEGIDVDAMSPGEIFIEQKAGFPAERIFYIGNNVSAEEMLFAIERGILVSIDSLAQLELFGKINPGGEVAVRFNPGTGAGHHEKVVTAGKATKFGVLTSDIEKVKKILQKYDLKLKGINQHIGSLFLDESQYIEGVQNLLAVAMEFTSLDFVDMGGGFGIPYRKKAEKRLDLSRLVIRLKELLVAFQQDYQKEITFKIEPGRYIVAECGLLLGTVHSVKENYGVKYVGTDVGFNVLARPVLYDSYHEIKVIKHNSNNSIDSLVKKERANNENAIVNEREQSIVTERATIVGNICESGDIIARDRLMPKAEEGDIIAVMDAGAYGYVMASNYNCRLKPAEVLIDATGRDRLIRKRETFDDLVSNFVNN